MTEVTQWASLDARDPLAPVREKFQHTPGLIYLDGNSLGMRPLAVTAALRRVVEVEWGRDLISSWNTADWVGLPTRVGNRIADLIGAAPATVIAGDSISVQLFNLLATAARLRPDRTVLVTDATNFPTDLYVASSVARLTGLTIRAIDPADPAQLEAAITADVAAVSLSHVDYRSGVRHDVAAITRQAHAVGALAVWDLAHSAGAMPIGIGASDADMAVGCTYKYLNGGPGSPAFIYVHPRLHEACDPALTGWFGHSNPFALEPGYRPAAGVDRFRIGTPSILAMSTLEAALTVFDDVDLDQLRQKSLALTDLFIDQIESRLGDLEMDNRVEVVAPREHDSRGSQVCLRHASAYGLVQALIANGVVGDYREPDLARFGFTPLTMSFTDVVVAVDRLEVVLRQREWAEPRFTVRASVT